VAGKTSLSLGQKNESMKKSLILLICIFTFTFSFAGTHTFSKQQIISESAGAGSIISAHGNRVNEQKEKPVKFFSGSRQKLHKRNNDFPGECAGALIGVCVQVVCQAAISIAGEILGEVFKDHPVAAFVVTAVIVGVVIAVALTL
jgi:hypothetical protein